MRFIAAGSDSEQRLLKDPVEVDAAQFEALKPLQPGTEEYGVALSKILFSQPALAVGFEKALSTSEALKSSLRVRLLLDTDEALLHDVQWECLNDLTGNAIASDHRILLSRYLPAVDWQPTVAAKEQLKALVLVASPSNLNDYSLTPIGDEAQLAKIRAAFGKVETKVVTGVTRLSLVSELNLGFDIIYVLCHGALVDGKPYLVLCDAKGEADLVEGTLVAGHVRDLTEAPRLVVLACCQSAQGLGSLAPMLAQAGVPAILALAGNFPVAAHDLFMPKFFEALLEDGFVDRAVAVARGMLRGQESQWMPVLYTRLKTGLLLKQPEPVAPKKSPWMRRILIGVAALVMGLGLLVWLVPTDDPAVLSYSVEVTSEGKQPEVLPSERTFQKGEHPAIHIEVPKAGYLYGFQRFDDGQYEVLLAMKVADSAQVRVPPDGSRYFGTTAGTVTLAWSSIEMFDLKDIVEGADIEADGSRRITHPDKIKKLDDKLTEYTASTRREVIAEGKPHAKLSSAELHVAYRFRLDVP